MSEFTIVKSIKLKNYLFILSSCVLCLFAGLRGAGVGVDDWVYIDVFVGSQPILNWLFGYYQYSITENWMEPGFSVFMALLRQFTEYYPFLFISVAVISIFSHSFFIIRASCIPILSLLLYYSHAFILRDLTQIRSGVAASLGIGVAYFAAKRKFYVAWAILIVACSFHSAAAVLSIPLIISIFRPGRRFLLGVLIFSIGISAMKITKPVLELAPDIGFISDKINHYVNSSYGSELPFFSLTNMKNLSLALMLILAWRRLNEQLYFRTMMTFFVVGVSWRFALGDFSIIAARGATFLTATETILIAGLVSVLRPRLVWIIVASVFGAAMLFLNFSANVIPDYHFFWTYPE